MKITSRRFGRATSQEDSDDGMGGGDYPTIVSDLSVEPELQVIPEQLYPELPQPAESAPDGAGDDFWSTVGSEPEKPHRFWRSRADRRELAETDDYPVVGAGPAVVSGLSIEPPLQAIPNGDGVQPTLTNEPPNYGGGNFWSTVGTEPERAPRPWWRRRTTYVVATVLVTVVAVVVSLIAFSGPAVKTKRIAYTFPVEAFPQTGVTVSRTWTLYGGQHPSLHGDLTFYSSRSDQVTVEELIPSSLATQASQVTFIPKPKIVGEDPVVASYSISSALDGVTSAEYTIPLPVNTPYTLAVLHKWAAEQSAESGQRYLKSHTLASIALTPATIVVKKGSAPYQLAISGLQQDGNAAPTIAFGTAKWSVANPKIAKVSSTGQVTGLAPGKTTVKAIIGKLSATATVTVSAAANVKPTPPLKPLTAGPLTSGPNSFPSSIGVLSTGGGTTNPPTHKPTTGGTKPGGSKPPVVKPPVNPPPVNPPPPPVSCTNAPMNPSATVSPDNTTVTVTWQAPVAVAGCSVSVYGVSGTDNGALVNNQLVGGGTLSTTFSGFSQTTTQQDLSFSIVAWYNQSPSGSVGAAATIPALPPPPPPPPTCDPTTQDIAASNFQATSTGNAANADEFTISWTPGTVATGSPCSVTGETATLNGLGVTNGSVVTATPGLNTVVVTTTFADGSSQSPTFTFNAP